MGCPFLQGYHLGAPIPVDELVRTLVKITTRAA
jgi:EAL domain-containing protein (putative c-di-GMP-specific phosphodiesterase class I)